MDMLRYTLALAVALVAGAAQAADNEPCGTGLICANAPQTIVDAMQKAGYKAVLGKDRAGDPMIESAANGYNFSIFFYECVDNKACGSLQFLAHFEASDEHTPAYANLWNRTKRFSQMSIEADKSISFRYDISTYGGLNARNFADQIDWWDSMLGELAVFFKENAKGS